METEQRPVRRLKKIDPGGRIVSEHIVYDLKPLLKQYFPEAFPKEKDKKEDNLLPFPK